MLISPVDWMYSRCPHCHHRQALTVEQLRIRRGLLNCSACGGQFDSLRFLSTQEGGEFVDELDEQFSNNSAMRPQNSAVWLAASAATLLLLAAQIVYFEGARLSMQPQFRTGLEKACAAIACRLPVYRNLGELAVSHSDLQVQGDHSYLFTAAISNQALFAQTAPDLKLTLFNFNGQALAERVFSARQYLTGTSSLAAEQTAEVRLAIVAPAAGVGGYTFTLL